MALSAVTAPQDAFLEWSPPELPVHEQAEVRLVLRFGLERNLVEERLVELFRRPLDLQVQLAATWFDGLPGTLDVLELEPGSDGTVRIALGDELVRARVAPEVLIDGRSFRVWELERRVRPWRAGALELSPVELSYQHATEFTQDFLGARIPRNTQRERVSSEALVLDVLPLPTEGRPAAFTGAVGRFELELTVTPTSLSAGESLVAELWIRGRGNYAHFEPPPFVPDGELHLLGLENERSAEGLRATYEFTPLHGDVDAVPPFELWSFDPEGEGHWLLHSTEAVALEVSGPPRPAPEPDEPEASDSSSGAPETSPAQLLLLTGLVALGAASLGVLLGLRLAKRRAGTSRSRMPPTPASMTLGRLPERPAAAFATRHGPAPTLMQLLAERAGLGWDALLQDELAQELERSGLAPGLAERIANAAHAELGARYGGPATDMTPAQLDQLREEFEHAVTRTDASP